MGWKISMVVIKSEKSINEKEFLESLGYQNLEETEEELLDTVLMPDEGKVYIGKYNGNIIICNLDMVEELIYEDFSPINKTLTEYFPDVEIASLLLQSTINLWGYSLFKNGGKLRARLGSSDTGTIIDFGDVLEEEESLFSNSFINDEGERIFKFEDNNEDEFFEGQVGEKFVFNLSKRFFGKSLDRADDSFFDTQLKGFSYKEFNAALDTENHKIVASENVIQGASIDYLHKLSDMWLVLSIKDIENEDENEDAEYFYYSESMLYYRIPKLKGMLDQKDETTINIDNSTGEITVNPKHFHYGIPTHSAKSTRQANTEFSYKKWITVNKSHFIKILKYIIIFLLLGYFLSWLFYIIAGIIVAMNILMTSKDRDMFYSGDLGAGIVIDEKTSTIAALTDLSHGTGKYPLIRITKVNLPKEYLKSGTKLAIAGAFQRMGKYPFWNYFDPIPLISGLKYPESHQHKIEQIPLAEWKKLEFEIDKLNDVPKEGYYPIDIETSSWKDIDIDSIKWVK